MRVVILTILILLSVGTSVCQQSNPLWKKDWLIVSVEYYKRKKDNMLLDKYDLYLRFDRKRKTRNHEYGKLTLYHKKSTDDTVYDYDFEYWLRYKRNLRNNHIDFRWNGIGYHRLFGNEVFSFIRSFLLSKYVIFYTDEENNMSKINKYSDIGRMELYMSVMLK